MSKSNIEWTEETWNPIVGCDIVSPGCTNCYAMKMASRIEAMNAGNRAKGKKAAAPQYDGTTKKIKGNAVWTGKLSFTEDVLLHPLRRKKPTTYFVNSEGDLFHEKCPDEWIDRVFAVMALCPQHTFQVLTKRAQRMLAYLNDPETARRIFLATDLISFDFRFKGPFDNFDAKRSIARLPLTNVWLGVSCERQKEADERIPHLMATPAVVRFISAEPLLEQIDISYLAWAKLDWVIVGGESGPQARPFDMAWADHTIDQCRRIGIRCFVKQLGANVTGPHSNGVNQTKYRFEDRKGGDWNEWPERLRVREMPQIYYHRSCTDPQNAEAIVP